MSTDFSGTPTWYGNIQVLFTAQAGRPNSISCMQQSQYQIDLSSYDTFPGPDLTGQGYATCALAIQAAITPPGTPMFMPEPPDKPFSQDELNLFAAWINANYPKGTPPGGSADDESVDDDSVDDDFAGDDA